MNSALKPEQWDQPRWWVLTSRPRCEKKIRTILENNQLEVFLPCRQSMREYASKTVTFEVPLFPGYVFAQFTPGQKSEVLAAAPTSGFLDVTDQHSFIEQMDALKGLLNRTKQVDICPFIEKGKKVRITSGKFKGLEGFVTRRLRRKRLVLSIDLLRQSVEVELPAESVALTA